MELRYEKIFSQFPAVTIRFDEKSELLREIRLQNIFPQRPCSSRSVVKMCKKKSHLFQSQRIHDDDNYDHLYTIYRI